MEIRDDETAVTAVDVLQRAVTWFASRGVTIERVLSDNGGAYRSGLWRDTCGALSIVPKRTRPYRPQTNGKVERFHRTMREEFRTDRVFESLDVAQAELDEWVAGYNHQRPHSSIGMASWTLLPTSCTTCRSAWTLSSSPPTSIW